ncbi:hypothetical protein [Terribacillus saccharophilus]|uniref:Uncharacterized protein n=1 Tax=Terribacillus saccharophilus TaxID=361277 RepID=A0A268A973_9BACI|nr:hypothetical protein [Terribacillus saccharophilus]PAD20663.1 hypothetical protein CHH64_12185 [Terribacillus saccharophilus]
MKKKFLVGALVTGLVITGGLSTSALASSEEASQKQAVVVDSDNGTYEPQAVPAAAVAAGRAATMAWKAIPAADKMMVKEGLKSMIGLGGVQQSEDSSVDKKELEYLFDN